MTAQELKYDFLIKKDRIQSLSTSNFNDAEIDWFLNEAQSVFIKQRLGTTNTHRASYEQLQKRTDDLSTLHVKFPLQPPLPLIDHQNVFEYHSFLRATVKVTSCAKELPLRFSQTDDLSEVLRDPFNDASSSDFVPFNFGMSADAKSSIFIYPGLLKPVSIQMEYIRIPNKITQGTYTYIDGTIPITTTSELPTTTHSEIVDLAVWLAQVSLAKDPQEKLLVNE
jgi:hypothetical protein